jgi:transposase InsO family protein
LSNSISSILDGFSRLIVHWDIRPEMKEIDIEAILQLAKERYPEARPRIISDNGPQFIANDFKSFIRLSGMTHVRTSPYYPQATENWSDITSHSRANAYVPRHH